jgi:hypothetical protein
MTGRDSNPTCERFAEWLADALDGTAAGDPFAAHRRGCPSCQDLQASATEGRRWLRALEPVDPPPTLVRDILAVTRDSREVADRRRAWAPAIARSWDEAGRLAAAVFHQPRLAMTAAMAFFSLSMIANVTGATLDDLRRLNPATVVSGASLCYYQAAAGVARYYDNNRFLRELRTELRELRDAASEAPANDASPGEKETEIHG